jgi:tRNA dimethylallyltransferase
MSQNDPAILPLVVVVGPTASGKSALSVALARELGAEIIVCDSTQLYRGVNIGTSKPSEGEQRTVRHHLIDVLDPSAVTTAGGYRDLAIASLAELRARQKRPILTAGTGLYLRALLEGLADLPLRSEEVRERLRKSAASKGAGHLHAVLRRIDPEAAAKIAATDEQKLIRAIEVCVLTRRPISEVHRDGRKPLEGWRAIKIGLMPERDVLYQRIAARTEQMLRGGWIEEVQALLLAGLTDDAKIFEFIGYREVLAVVRGRLKVDEAREAIQLATRHYAKRQLTWFRKDPQIRWFSGPGDEPEIQRQAHAWLAEQLAPAS